MCEYATYRLVSCNSWTQLSVNRPMQQPVFLASSFDRVLLYEYDIHKNRHYDSKSLYCKAKKFLTFPLFYQRWDVLLRNINNLLLQCSAIHRLSMWTWRVLFFNYSCHNLIFIYGCETCVYTSFSLCNFVSHIIIASVKFKIT